MNPYSVKKQSRRTLFNVIYTGEFGHTLKQGGNFLTRELAQEYADRLYRREIKFDKRRKLEGNR